MLCNCLAGEGLPGGAQTREYGGKEGFLTMGG